MRRVLLCLCLLVAAGALAQLLRHALSGPEADASASVHMRVLGWLDDDGAPRGERWDGSPFSGPRTALSLG